MSSFTNKMNDVKRAVKNVPATIKSNPKRIALVVFLVLFCCGFGYYIYRYSSNQKDILFGSVKIDIEQDITLEELKEHAFLKIIKEDNEGLTFMFEGITEGFEGTKTGVIKIPFIIKIPESAKEFEFVNNTESEVEFQCNEYVTIKKNGKAINTIVPQESDPKTFTCTPATFYQISKACENGGNVVFDAYDSDVEENDGKSCETLVAESEATDCGSDKVIKNEQNIYSCAGCTNNLVENDQSWSKIDGSDDTCVDVSLTKTTRCNNYKLDTVPSYKQTTDDGNAVFPVAGYTEAACWSRLSYKTKSKYEEITTENQLDKKIKIRYRILLDEYEAKGTTYKLPDFLILLNTALEGLHKYLVNDQTRTPAITNSSFEVIRKAFVETNIPVRDKTKLKTDLGVLSDIANAATTADTKWGIKLDKKATDLSESAQSAFVEAWGANDHANDAFLAETQELIEIIKSRVV